MVRGEGVYHAGEGLFLFVERVQVILQERPVEDAPSSVEVIVVGVFGAAEITVEASVERIHVEIHGAVVTAMEHGGAITVRFQDGA